MSELVSPHPLYLQLGRGSEERQTAYRELFRAALGEAPVRDLRMALNQDQPIGNDRFYAEVEAKTRQKRELRKRGRPKKTEPETGN